MHPISRTISSCKTETPDPLDNTSRPRPTVPGHHIRLSSSFCLSVPFFPFPCLFSPRTPSPSLLSLLRSLDGPAAPVPAPASSARGWAGSPVSEAVRGLVTHRPSPMRRGQWAAPGSLTWLYDGRQTCPARNLCQEELIRERP